MGWSRYEVWVRAARRGHPAASRDEQRPTTTATRSIPLTTRGSALDHARVLPLSLLVSPKERRRTSSASCRRLGSEMCGYCGVIT